MAGITLNFLEEILKDKIKSFEVGPGSNLGDNFSTVLHSITINFESEKSPLHLILKSYPSHPARQKFLDDTNLFQKELLIYNTLLPKLNHFFIENISLHDEKQKQELPFPPFVDGRAMKRSESEELANYILLVDIRKTWGYKMADRFEGLDFNHCRLLMKELAKIHATCWAYKVKNELTSLIDKFDYVKDVVFCDKQAGMIEQALQQSFDTLSPLLGDAVGFNSEIFIGFQRFKENCLKMVLTYINDNGDIDEDTVDSFLRLKPTQHATCLNPAPWKVGSHGDCWTNNMLFLYDNDSNVPSKMILVDLQLFREACPTLDLVYFFYTSTTHELRLSHLDELLDFYSHYFLKCCKLHGVDQLPDFTPEELKRRFHQSKPFGLLMAVLIIPLILRSAEDAQDMDKLVANGEAKDMADMLTAIHETPTSNKAIAKRIVSMAEELFSDGVL